MYKHMWLTAIIIVVSISCEYEPSVGFQRAADKDIEAQVFALGVESQDKSEEGETGTQQSINPAPPPAQHKPARIVELTPEELAEANKAEEIAQQIISEIEKELLNSFKSPRPPEGTFSPWEYSGWTKGRGDAGFNNSLSSSADEDIEFGILSTPSNPDNVWTDDVAYIHVNWSGANHGIKSVLDEFSDDTYMYSFQHLLQQAAQVWMESGMNVQIDWDGFASDDPGWSDDDDPEWGEVATNEILVFADANSDGDWAMYANWTTRKASITVFDKNRGTELDWYLTPDDSLDDVEARYLYALFIHEFGHTLGMDDDDSDSDFVMNFLWNITNVNNWMRGPTEAEIEALWNTYGRDDLALKALWSTNGINWYTDDTISSAETWQPVDIGVDEDDNKYQIVWFSETANHYGHVAWYNGTSGTLSDHYYDSDVASFNGASVAHDGVDTSLVAYVAEGDYRRPRYWKITDDNASGSTSTVSTSVRVIGRPGIARTTANGEETWVYAAIVRHLDDEDYDQLGKIYIWTSTNDGTSWNDPVQLTTTYHGLRGATLACTDDNICRLAINRTGRPAYQRPCYLLSIRFHIDGDGEADYDAVNTTTSYSPWGPAINVDDNVYDKWMMAWLGMSGSHIYHRMATGTGGWGSKYQTLADAEEGLGIIWNEDWENSYEMLYPVRD